MSATCGVFMMSNVVLLSHFKFFQDHDNQKSAIFWMLLIQISLSMCMSLAFEKQVFDCKWTDWILIIAHSATFVLIIPMEIYFSSRLPGVVISVIGSTAIVYPFIAQYTILSHIHSGYMNVVEIGGICLVMFGSVFPAIVKAVTQTSKMNGTMK